MGKKKKAICLLFCMICSLSACAQKPGSNMDFKDMESDVSIDSSQMPAQDMPLMVIAPESKLTIVPSETRVSEFTKCVDYTEEESDFYNITPDYIADNSEFEIFKDVSSTDSFIMYDGEVYSIGICFGGFGLTSMALADLNQDGAYELYYTFSFGSGVHALRIGYFDPVKKEVTILDCPLQSHGHELMLTANESGDLCVNIAVIDENTYQSFVDFSLEAQELIGTVIFGEDTIALQISMDEFIGLLGQDGAADSEERPVLVETDDWVRFNRTFAAFMDNEIPAYDGETGENKYIYEYFADYGVIYGIHYMVEDLNQDAKVELLVLVQDDRGFGSLFVFEETESGELIAWEEWWNIMEDRWPYVYYCGDGIFITEGEVDGISVGHYTQEGTQESLLFYHRTLTESNDTYYELSIWWEMYENGEITKYMEYKCYHDQETHEHIKELETKEAREGERLVDKFLAELGEWKKISIENIEVFSLGELQNP
ncbi:MAG: hypothetical protein HDR08_05645 [Lachnospiraceae bacterium]|nr:hypothetical protein [Lachnospiraceae bacterium]